MAEQHVDIPCFSFGSFEEKPSPQKTWTELHQSVRDIRYRFSNLSTKVPSNFTFRSIETENGEIKTRLYFLSVPSSGRETTLLYTDLQLGCSFQNVANIEISNAKTPILQRNVLSWHHLLESSFHVLSFRGKISKEEQLQWERKRQVTWGITTYEFHPESGRFIFPACSTLFTCQDTGTFNSPYFPEEIKASCGGARLNPQLCPTNPELVAFICNGDIWLQHLGTGFEQRLTFLRKGAKSLADDPLSAGLPAYVTQEEFHRFTGFWWQPCKSDTYKILYEVVDETDVEILYFPPASSEDHGFEEYRFPRAGTANAVSSLKLLQFNIDSLIGQALDIKYLNMQECLQVLFPWMEYLVRVGWMADGQNIWAQLLDRKQVHLELVLIPLSLFVPVVDVYAENSHNHVVPSSSVTVLISERSNTWINVHDILYFFKQENKSVINFIWASEETGFRHLYLVTVDVDTAVVNHNVENSMPSIHNDSVNSKVSRKIALTWGDWEVLEKQVWIDEEKQLVYFIAFKDGVLEKHLYVVSLRHPGVIRRLTATGYSHNVTLSKDCSMFVTVYSNISSLPICEVFLICAVESSSMVSSIVYTSMGFLLEPSVPDDTYQKPDIFCHQIQSGETLYCMVFKPKIEPGKKYPTVLSVYGGPEVQLVNNSFKGMRQLRLHMLSAHGYVVVVIDSRGSRHRGLNFEAYIKDRMGTVEIADQVEILEWLASVTGYIDINRVAIHGWSYGGYLSLMGLAQRPDVFKVAVAGAPVTSWRLYDTAYTERYMGMPCENPQGYRTGSVLSYVTSFPNEPNRLLIIHGLIDENVHFLHTRELVDALIKATKPYSLQLYPKERHSLRQLDASEHYETTLLNFLQQYL